MNKYILLISGVISVALASIISVVPIGIANQAQVSAMFPTLFTPATFTFSIWGLIYLSWIILGAFYFWKGNFVKKDNLYLLAAAQILSSLWLIPSQFLYIGTSFVVMLGVLVLLLKLFIESRGEEYYFRYTVDLFLGWILVASIANLHLLLVSYGLYDIPVFLTVSSIALAFVASVIFFKIYNSFIPGLVFMWAIYGILSAQENMFVLVVAGALGLGLITIFFHEYAKHHIK